jgi:hypothetical protein
MIPFRTTRVTNGPKGGRIQLRGRRLRGKHLYRMHLRGVRLVIPRVALLAALHLAPPLSRGQLAEVGADAFTLPPKLLDSLALEKLDLEIAHARDRVRMTDFWHRLLPRVSLSAGFAGGGDLLILNPEDRTSPQILRSSFRISFSLPLSDVISDAEHQGAILDLKKLCLAWAELQIRHAEAHRLARVQLAALTEQRTILSEQLMLLDHVARFKQMQFDRGKLEFDALMRARMDLLSMRLRISALDHQFLERADLQQVDSSRSSSQTE